jgi:ATP-dependent Clp protease adapter protein ClpS
VADEVRKSAEASDGEGSTPGGRALPTGVGGLPACNVTLRRTATDDMLQVVRSLIEVARLEKERALEVAFEAQMTGAALVVVTHRERAELYQNQFLERGVRVEVQGAKGGA